MNLTTVKLFTRPTLLFSAVAILLILAGSHSSYGADRFCVGATWNTTASWSISTGGGGGASIPGSGDIAIFDVNSPSCAIDVNVNVAGINVTNAYISTLTQNTGRTITTGLSNWIHAGGIFSGGDSALLLVGNGASFTQSAGTFTATSGTWTTGNGSFSITGGTFNHNNGTVKHQARGGTTTNAQGFFNLTIDQANSFDARTISGTIPVANELLIQTGGFRSGTIELSGDVTVLVGGNRDGAGRSGVIEFVGTGAQTLDANGQAVNEIHINKSSGTLNVVDSLTCKGDSSLWRWTQGAVAWTTGKTMTIRPNQIPNISDSNTDFQNIIINHFDGNRGISVLGKLKVKGNLTITNGRSINGGEIELAGNLISTLSPVNGTTKITLNGTGAQTINTGGSSIPDGLFTINKASGTATLLANLTLDGTSQRIDVTSGTLDLNGFNLSTPGVFNIKSSGVLRLEGGETVSPTPTLDAGSTVTYDGSTGPYTVKDWTYRNLSLEQAGTVFQLAASEQIAETLSITAGIFSLNGNNLDVTGALSNADTLRLQGSETLTLTSGNDTNSGTIEYVGDADSLADTFILKDLTYFNLLVNFTDALDVLPPSGLSSLVVNGALTTKGGTFNMPAIVTVTGLALVNGGTLQAGTTLNTFNSGLTLSAGTFTGNAGVVDVNGDFALSTGTFTAPNTQMLVSGNFNHVSGSFLASTGQVELDGVAQTISGTTAFNNFKKVVTATETLIFEQGSTQTFLGTVELSGASGNLLSLRSSVGGSQWNVSPQGPRNISFVSVRDGANLTLPVINPPNSINSGNNSNWFNPVPIAINDAYDAQQDTVLNIPTPGVLANDTDVDNDPLNAIVGTGPSNGSVTITPDGSFTYTPNPGFTGTDSFTYQANDGPSNSNTGTVVLTVRFPINPNATGTPTVIALGDSTQLASNPVGGTGSYVSYSWTGPDGFSSSAQNPTLATPSASGLSLYTVTVTDSAGFSGTATVTISVIESALKPNGSATPAVISLGDSFELGSTPTGGTGVYLSFNWTGPDGFSSSAQNPGTITPTRPGPGTYTLTITDASGLVAIETINIIVGQPLASVLIKKSKAIYNVSSLSNAEKPLDKFKVTFVGVDISAGDKVAILFNNVSVGDLTTGDGLTMDARLRAKGQLMSGNNVFQNCRAKFKARKRSLTFIAQRGVAARNGAPLVQSTSGTSEFVLVALLIDKAPADGVIDVAAVIPVRFKVKVRNNASGAILERGRKLGR